MKTDKRSSVIQVLTAVRPRDLAKMLAVYAAGVAVMYLLLAAVSLIPNAWIEDNVRAGMAVSQAEYIGRYTPIFSYAQADEMDFWTDNMIMQTLLQNEDQPLWQRAVDSGWEQRYWMGYKVWLRPAFILFTYVDMRVVMLYVFAALVLACLFLLRARFGTATAVGFGAAMVLGHTMWVPWLFQYFEVFWIALAAMIWLLRRYAAPRVPVRRLAMLFLIIGMATQYFDFLTAPPLTLCLPLAVVLLADMQTDAVDMAERWARFLWPCVTWAFGWLFGWAAKWPLSSRLLGWDVVGNALQQIRYRSALRGDTPGDPVNVLHALARNVFCFTPFSELRSRGAMPLYVAVQAVFACVLVWLAVRVLRRRPGRRQWTAVLPALCCAALPYLWFIAMAGHTEIHFIFTYRSQIASAFLVWNVWLYLMGRPVHDDLPPAAKP